MTPDEARKILKSASNVLAGKALDALKLGVPIAEFKQLVEKGASDIFYRRDPRHPRSRLIIMHVLDACFGAEFDVIARETTPSGGQSCTLGPTPVTLGKLEHFCFLLEKGFRPGSNGWRGELFQHIMASAFSNDNAAASLPFAKELVARGRVNIQRFAETKYYWLGSMERLRRIESLGATMNSRTLDLALAYFGCDQRCHGGDASYAETITWMLDAGIVPMAKLDDGTSSATHGRLKCERFGLLARLIELGAYSETPSLRYERFRATAA
jgi:hypothetical protein